MDNICGSMTVESLNKKHTNEELDYYSSTGEDKVNLFFPFIGHEFQI